MSLIHCLRHLLRWLFLSACFIVVASLNCHLLSSLIMCVSLMFGLRVNLRKPTWELIHVFSSCVFVTVVVTSSLSRRSREFFPGNSRKLTRFTAPPQQQECHCEAESRTFHCVCWLLKVGVGVGPGFDNNPLAIQHMLPVSSCSGRFWLSLISSLRLR